MLKTHFQLFFFKQLSTFKLQEQVTLPMLQANALGKKKKAWIHFGANSGEFVWLNL